MLFLQRCVVSTNHLGLGASRSKVLWPCAQARVLGTSSAFTGSKSLRELKRLSLPTQQQQRRISTRPEDRAVRTNGKMLLRRQQRNAENVAKRAELEAAQAAAAPPAVQQPNTVQPFIGQQVQQQAPTFGQSMKMYFMFGLGISLAMGFVSALFSVAFAHEAEKEEGEESGHDYVDMLTDVELENALDKVTTVEES